MSLLRHNDFLYTLFIGVNFGVIWASDFGIDLRFSVRSAAARRHTKIQIRLQIYRDGCRFWDKLGR